MGKLRNDVNSLADKVNKSSGQTFSDSEKARSGLVIVRNLTGDVQTLFIEGKEWRIPGDRRAYEINVESIRPENNVITEVLGDRPRVRSFKSVDGRWEVRFDIVWVQVQ
jgi:hypothetical protein